MSTPSPDIAADVRDAATSTYPIGTYVLFDDANVVVGTGRHVTDLSHNVAAYYRQRSETPTGLWHLMRSGSALAIPVHINLHSMSMDGATTAISEQA